MIYKNHSVLFNRGWTKFQMYFPGICQKTNNSENNSEKSDFFLECSVPENVYFF